MGQPRHGSDLTSPPTTCTSCGSQVRKQWQSYVWCDCGQWYVWPSRLTVRFERVGQR